MLITEMNGIRTVSPLVEHFKAKGSLLQLKRSKMEFHFNQTIYLPDGNMKNYFSRDETEKYLLFHIH